MTIQLPLLLLLALCSCQAPGSTEATDANRSPYQPSRKRPERAETPAQVGSLAGGWRVGWIDGRSLNDVGLALKANGQEIWWEPRCAGMARGYRITSQHISFRSMDPPRRAGVLTPPVCTIGLPLGLQQVFEALDHATTVLRTPSNGIEIAGPSHRITLLSQ